MTPLPHRFPGIGFAQLAAELEREGQHRRAFYRQQVQRGRMSESEARFQLAIVAAWLEDAARLRAAFAPVAGGKPAHNPNQQQAQHGLTWRQRTAALLRELELRSSVYPREVAEGTLDAPTAAMRVQCLQLLLSFYDDGLDWPTDPTARAALHTEVMARLHPETRQPELMLA